MFRFTQRQEYPATVWPSSKGPLFPLPWTPRGLHCSLSALAPLPPDLMLSFRNYLTFQSTENIFTRWTSKVNPKLRPGIGEACSTPRNETALLFGRQVAVLELWASNRKDAGLYPQAKNLSVTLSKASNANYSRVAANNGWSLAVTPLSVGVGYSNRKFTIHTNIIHIVHVWNWTNVSTHLIIIISQKQFNTNSLSQYMSLKGNRRRNLSNHYCRYWQNSMV